MQKDQWMVTYKRNYDSKSQIIWIEPEEVKQRAI